MKALSEPRTYYVSIVASPRICAPWPCHFVRNFLLHCSYTHPARRCTEVIHSRYMLLMYFLSFLPSSLRRLSVCGFYVTIFVHSITACAALTICCCCIEILSMFMGFSIFMNTLNGFCKLAVCWKNISPKMQCHPRMYLSIHFHVFRVYFCRDLLIDIMVHSAGSILTCWYVLEGWHYYSFWYIWVFLSLLPASIEVVIVLRQFCCNTA